MKFIIRLIILVIIIPGPKVLAQKATRTPAMGWMSWNLYGGNISEKIIKDIADGFIEKGLDKLGYKYICIDDGWVGGRDMKNRLIADPQKFPGGIKALADYVHSKGLKLGIYSSASQLTCMGFTASLGFEQLDANTFAEWGIDYLKYDWCNAPEDPESYRIRNEAMSQALAKTKRPVVFAFWGGWTPLDWFKDAGNSWRTFWDIRDIWASSHPQRAGILDAYEATIRFSEHAGPFAFNDPDMLVIGLYGKGKTASGQGQTGGCTDVEYRSQMSLWCLMASPLMLSSDIKTLSPTSLEIISNPDIISINQDSICKQAKRVLETNVYDILVKPLRGGSYAVGILNKSNQDASFKINFSEAGLIGSYKVWDVWQRKLITKSTDYWMGKVSAHETIVLRLSASVSGK